MSCSVRCLKLESERIKVLVSGRKWIFQEPLSSPKWYEYRGGREEEEGGGGGGREDAGVVIGGTAVVLEEDSVGTEEEAVEAEVVS